MRCHESGLRLIYKHYSPFVSAAACPGNQSRVCSQKSIFSVFMAEDIFTLSHYTDIE